MLFMPSWHLTLFASLIIASHGEPTSSDLQSLNQIIRPSLLHPYQNLPAVHNISANSNRLQARGDSPPDPRKHLRGGALRTYNDKSQSSSRSPSPSSSNQRTNSRGRPPRPFGRPSNAARPAPNVSVNPLGIPSQQIPRGRRTGPSQRNDVPPLGLNAVPPGRGTNNPNPNRLQQDAIPAHYPDPGMSEQRLEELFPARDSRPLDLSVFQPDHPSNRPDPPRPQHYHNPWYNPSQRISPERLKELFPLENNRPLDLSVLRPQHAAAQQNHGRWQGHNPALDRLRSEPPVGDRDINKASVTGVSLASGTGDVRDSATSPGAQPKPNGLRLVMGPPPRSPQKIRILPAPGQGPRTVQHQIPIQQVNSLQRLNSWELPAAAAAQPQNSNQRASSPQRLNSWELPAGAAAHSPNSFHDLDLLQQPVVTLPTSGRAQVPSPTRHQNPVQQTTPFQNVNPWQYLTTGQFHGIESGRSPFQNSAQQSSPFLNHGPSQQPGGLVREAGPGTSLFHRASSFSNSSPFQNPNPSQHQAPIQTLNPLLSLQRLPNRESARQQVSSNWFRTGIGSPEGTDRGYGTLSVAEMAEEARRLTLNPFDSFPQARRIPLPPAQSGNQSQAQRITSSSSRSAPSAQNAPLSPVQSQAGSYAQAEGQPQSPGVRLIMDSPREMTQKDLTPKRQKKDGK